VDGYIEDVFRASQKKWDFVPTPNLPWAARVKDRLDWSHVDYEHIQRELGILSSTSSATSYDRIVQELAVNIANECNAEEVKAILNELPAEIGGLLTRYLQPETPGNAKEDLKTLYESIQFEGYDLNQKMTPVEIALLHEWIPKGKKVLEAGCGTGRLLVPLAKLGFDISGFDYTPRHVSLVQQELQKADLDPSRVKQGDWLNTGYPDASTEVITCLGRNILHEYRLERQRQLFSEMNRLLQPGGVFIFDIPDRTVPGSHYEQLTEGYHQTMRQKGIHNTRQGTIFDSPDNKNFATRYVYSDQDIHALASEAGFEIEKRVEEDLPTGQGDRNIYYILKKVSEPRIQKEEKQAA
jgi:SAM-dependent methyltransferase